MKLIFELGVEGRGMTLMPECDVPEYQLPEERSEALHLPHVSENELTRHYTALCKRIHGVNDGFYPLGSCTMKYNPKIDEDMAALPGFTQLHPLQPHGGQAQGVGAVGAACGEHTPPLVAAQARRAHGGPPAFARGILRRHRGKLPDQPEPVIALDAHKGVRVTVFRLKHNACRQLRHQPALARNPEFIGKIGMNMCNGMNYIVHRNTNPLFAYYYIRKRGKREGGGI